MLLIQSGMAIRTRPSGSPEENDRRTTEAVRQDVIAALRLARVPSLSGVGELALVTRRDDRDWPAGRPAGRKGRRRRGCLVYPRAMAVSRVLPVIACVAV